MANTTITPPLGSIGLIGYPPTIARSYPSLPITINSRFNKLDGRLALRASNGILKSRKLYPADKLEFALEHELTSAQKTSLDSHYSTDGLNSFPYTWPGVGTPTYTVRYLGAPQYQEMPGGWYKASVKLGEA